MNCSFPQLSDTNCTETIFDRHAIFLRPYFLLIAFVHGVYIFAIIKKIMELRRQDKKKYELAGYYFASSMGIHFGVIGFSFLNAGTQHTISNLKGKLCALCLIFTGT